MKLKKLVSLALITLCSLSYTQAYSDDQINPDDKLDAKTYIQWKTEEPQKLEQLKAYIQACIPATIDSATLDRDIKRALSFYKSKITLTIDDLTKKICAKHMFKKKAITTKRKKQKKPKALRPTIKIPTEDMTIDQLKEKLYKTQKEIELTLSEKYTILTIVKIAGKDEEITANIQELDYKLQHLHLERATIIELSKRNGQKNVHELSKLAKEFDTLMGKVEKCYQDDLKEI